MLQSKNLDDQTFDEIMEFVMGRLPWLCPAWTDYNEHDPGITILELMAWYKEMQQYHMNTMTDALRRKLLKLLGVVPASPRPARLTVTLPYSQCDVYPVLSRLESPQEIPFELSGKARRDSEVAGVYLKGGDGAVDATEMLRQKGVAVWPFGDYGGEKTELLLRIRNAGPQLKLYFEIDEDREIARNPFADNTSSPRTLEWSLVGGNKLSVADETHALSISGYVTIDFSGELPVSDGGCVLPAGNYIRVVELEHGCEERVHLKAVNTGCFEAVQRETLALTTAFTVSAGPCSVLLEDAVSLKGSVLAFLKADSGLRPVAVETEYTGEGLSVSLDASGAAEAQNNLLLVSLDPLRAEEMMLTSTGLPDMALDFQLAGRRALTDDMTLICDTRCQDGEIRPSLWRYVADISMCGPRDAVFTFDPAREQLLFGDGEHGMVVPSGEKAVLIASMAVSYCSGGNLPENCGLAFEDGVTVANTAAAYGAEAESAGVAARAFLHDFKDTKKCASAEDYENAAKATPGLRVATAKAIVGFDPDEPGGKTRIPTVTVVTAPYSGTPRPTPDARFLAAVQAHLDALRPICTVVKAAAPRYTPVGISVSVCAVRGCEARVRKAVENYFAVDGTREIGDNVLRDDLIAALSGLPEVMKVERMELRALGADCYAGARGDLIVKKNAAAYPAEIEVLVK